MDKKKYIRPQLETTPIVEQLMVIIQQSEGKEGEYLSREKGAVNDEEEANSNWE